MSYCLKKLKTVKVLSISFLIINVDFDLFLCSKFVDLQSIKQFFWKIELTILLMRNCKFYES